MMIADPTFTVSFGTLIPKLKDRCTVCASVIPAVTAIINSKSLSTCHRLTGWCIQTAKCPLPLPSLLRLRSIFHRPSEGTNKAIVIFVDLFQTASNPPTDVSALESSISALESAISALEAAIRALDNRSLPWEHALRWFTGMVIVGVALEWWVIRHDFREEMETWCRRRVAPGFAPSCSHI